MKTSFQKLIYKLIYSIAALFFCLFLSSPLLALTFDRVVAKVNGDVITMGKLERSVAVFLQSNNNPNPLSQSLQGKEVMKQVLEKLVVEKLKVHEAKKIGIEVSNATIKNALADIYKDNNITSEQFETMLRNEGTNLESYKEIIRDQILVSSITKRELSSTASATEGSMKKYYKKNKNLFWVPEQIVIRHIMLIKENNSSFKEKQLLKNKIKEILMKIKAGINFADLAKKYSTDVSAHSGGLLGVVNRGTMMPEFEKAAFDLKVGEVSGVVETVNGFHIIKCDNVIPGYTNKYNMVKLEIKKKLNAKLKEKKYKKWISDLKKSSFVEISLFDDLKPIKKNGNSSSFKRNQVGSSAPGKSKRYLKNKNSNKRETLTRERLIEDKLKRYKKLFLNGKITKETFSKRKRELLENL